jgi:hypothetical protein
MSPAEVLQDVYGRTPIQQLNTEGKLPSSSFTQAIENARTPFPAPPKMETPSVSVEPPQTQNWQPPIIQQQQQPQKPNQSPEEIMRNLQHAIEEAKKNPATRGNLPQNTTNIPRNSTNFNK